MDIFPPLFSVSISMAGFISIFIIFRYQTMDAYVDNRKPLIITELKSKIKNNPYLLLRIQNIGKNKKFDDNKFFSKFQNCAIDRFVREILFYRELSGRIVFFGIYTILLWLSQSLFYLINMYLITQSVNEVILNKITIFSIILFFVSISVSFYFLYISLNLRKMKEKIKYI